MAGVQVTILNTCACVVQDGVAKITECVKVEFVNVAALDENTKGLGLSFLPARDVLQHGKAWTKAILLFREFCPQVDKAAHHVPVADKKRGALTDKPARELASGISGTEHSW